MSPPERSAGRWLTGLAATLLVALALRALFPLADPPWLSTIGITWHDEGVWAHNARNKALFGQWRLDQWNPMYVSPVFTGLEYLSFSAFGVGLWQSRVVSIVAGLAATFALAIGLRAVATPGVALTGALLMAVNFTWVMYSRVALLEATMVAALVASWACYARAERNWRWGIGAALFGLLAFFTKASAAFFLVALGLDACWVGWRAWRSRTSGGAAPSVNGAIATFAVLGVGTLVALAVFVVPNWTEYSFYNLFVYGSRRSSMGLERAGRSGVVVPGRPRVLHSPVAAHFRVTVWTGGHTGAVPSRLCRQTSARPLVPAGSLRTRAARPGERAAVRVPDSAHGLPGSAAADPGAARYCRTRLAPGPGRRLRSRSRCCSRACTSPLAA